MNFINQIILEGNVVTDVYYTIVPVPHARVEILSLRSYRDSDGNVAEEKSCFEVEGFGSLAESMKECCMKGRGMRVIGRLKQNRWKDGDGVERGRVFVVAEHVEFKPFKG